MKLPAWIAGIVFLCSFPLCAFDLTTGKTLPVIVLPEKADQSTVLAANELSGYVKKVSGKTLSVVQGKSDAEKQIVIGTLETVKEAPPALLKKLQEGKKSDAFIVAARGTRLYIIGKNRVAELYGTYQFLEDKLGVRWLKAATPEDDGEYIPKNADLSFSDFELYREPWFTHRRLDQCGSAWNVIPKNGISWAVRNGFQCPPPYGFRPDYNKDFAEFFPPRTPDEVLSGGGGHTTFTAAVPPALFKTHPEYFSLLDGKRTLFDGGHQCYQYCISNPEVQQKVADYILSRIEKYGSGKASYLFGMADTSVGWCECPECRKLDKSEKYNYLNVTNRFHAVVQKIAEKVYSKCPDARLYVWAYHTYREIPKDVKINPRMEVQYCIHGRCYGHKLDDPECLRNVKQYELLKEWLKLSPSIFSYEYLSSTPPLYMPHERTQAHDLKLYKQLGMTGYKEEAPFEDSRFVGEKKDDSRKDAFPSCWQWLYVNGKLLWNPDRNVDEVLADAESKYYGAAYPAMKKYHDLRRKLWENGANDMGYPTGDQRSATLLNTPGSKEALLGYLTEAEKLAGNDKTLLHRIGLDKKWLERYWIKPNEELKSKFGNAFRAPKASSKIVIDGDGKDPAWAGAFYTDAFKETFTDAHADIPAPLKTTVGILSDDKYLYFLITAMEPQPGKLKAVAEKDGPVWGEDGMEIFLYPPTAANTYYQIAVNSKGTVFDAICPGTNAKYDLGAEVKTKVLNDRYVIELKVPADKIGPFERGALWRIHFARNRKIKDDGFAASYSIDGTGYHDTVAYRTLEIGSPYLRNGSFDDLKDGKAQFWNTDKNVEFVKNGNGFALHYEKGGSCYQLLTDPALWQSKSPRKISISLKASGTKTLNLCFLRYTDTPDSKAKHGYTRKFLPTVKVAELQLEKEPKIFTAEYTIAPEEWAGLLLQSYFEFTVDDVSVKLIK